MLSLILYIVSLIALFASLVMIGADLSGLTDFGYVAYLPAAALIFFTGAGDVGPDDVRQVRFTGGMKGYRNVRNEDV